MSEPSMHGRLRHRAEGSSNRFQFECLEDRRLLAAVQFLESGVLEVACCDLPETMQADYAVDSEFSAKVYGSGALDQREQLVSGGAMISRAAGGQIAPSLGFEIPTHSPNGIALQNANAKDIAGGTFRTAYEIGDLNGRVVLSDSVSKDDRVDIFSFRLVQDSSIAIDLRGLTDDADLYLYNGDQQFVSGSVTSRSLPEEITENLKADEYFLLVLGNDDAATDYEVQFSASPKSAQDAGNFFSSSFDLGGLDSTAIINESVGGDDPRDFFRFSIEQDSKIAVSVKNLSANVTLLIYDIDKNLIIRSSNSRLQDELANFEADAGDYFVRVNQAKGFVTDYRLDIEVSPADGRFEDVSYYGSSNDWNLNSINAPEVWAAGFRGDGVTVAVIDTGVDYEHTDLVDGLWVNVDEVAGNGIDDDGNGFVDDYYGWDFVDSDALPLDENGHGTHVAGTIGAARNGFGVTGVAYESSIMSIRVLDENGSGFYSDVSAGIYYAVNNGADIINLSLGGPPGSGLFSALEYAENNGVLVVASAGNESSSVPTYPASYSSNLTNLISVGAYDSSQSIAAFSNLVGGSGAVQVDAPGVNIASTYSNDRYARMSGTSMAAPHVAGLAALIIDANRGLDPHFVRELIISGAVNSIGQSDASGGIDAARSVYIAANSSDSSFAITSFESHLSSGSVSQGLGNGLTQVASHEDAICRANQAEADATPRADLLSRGVDPTNTPGQFIIGPLQGAVFTVDRNSPSDVKGSGLEFMSAPALQISDDSLSIDELFGNRFQVDLSIAEDIFDNDIFDNDSYRGLANQRVADDLSRDLQLQTVDAFFQDEGWL